MHDSDSMDLYMVCADRDVRLLRHFLTSYNLFFKSSGKIFLWIWRKHQYLLSSIKLPKNLVLLFKDDVPELMEDDFKNQMYLKLIAHRFVETEWYWEPDADYLIVSPLRKSDFFYGEKPYWFYCTWHEIAIKTFRAGSEAFMGKGIPLQFLDEAQFVHSKKISHEFSKSYDLKTILGDGPLAAEQIVYGAYAFEQFHDAYHWVDYAKYDGPIVSYKVNQRPPSYLELNDAVKLADLPVAKYQVLWSYWEKAEEKMVEFLIDAQKSAFGEVLNEPDNVRLFRYWPLSEIDGGQLDGVDGIYSDRWLMRDVWFCIAADDRSILVIEISVPGTPSGIDSPLQLFIGINEQEHLQSLNPGAQTIVLNLQANIENRIAFRFAGGFAEPNGERTLFAKMGTSRLVATDSTD